MNALMFRCSGGILLKNGFAGIQTDGNHSVAFIENVADSAREHEVQQAIARLRRESRWYLLRVVGSMGCALLAFVSVFLAVAPTSAREPNVALLVGCVLCMIVCGILIPHSDSKPLAVLAEAPDVTMIAPLLEVLEAAPEARARKIHALLTLLLPQISATDAVLLNRRQRRVLYDALLLGDADRELDYLQAVLQAVTQIGDTEVLTCLRQLVQRGAVTDGQQSLFEAASECLRIVEARQAHQHIHDSLLRASAAEESAAELLRAAQSTLETSPQTLLRPGQ